MQQKTKLGINFGFRGWMLMIFEITAFLLFQSFSNMPMNLLAEGFSPDGTSAAMSPIYTAGMLVGIVIQLVLANFIGKMKSVKTMTLIFGAITLVAALGVATLEPGTTWTIAWFLVCVFSTVYGMFGIGILIGQWFPTRKGVFMGIATFAFPVCNGLMGPVANIFFNPEYMARVGHPNILGGFLPFLIVGLVGWLIGLIFIKDYPEQCGCYRDNDKSFTKEKADAMLAAEIEAKKTTVWHLKNTLKSGQFWLITIPMGALLMCSVGMMTQTNQIFNGAGLGEQFGMLMALVMVFALAGSYVLGLVDGKWGTKLAVTISVVVMLLSGILGAIGGKTPTIIAIILLAIFMGAGSNFTVSAAAQYWRREDFSTVFGVINPIANIIQCLGPMMVAMTVFKAVELPFLITAVISVISLIMVLCFKPAKVKNTDDKYRAAAGKVLDDELVGRK